MRPYINEACEEIDAAMFTGDAFNGEDGDAVCHRKGLRSYMGRWARQLVRNETQEELNVNKGECPGVECLLQKHCQRIKGNWLPPCASMLEHSETA